MTMKLRNEPKSIFERFCLDSSILGLKYFYLYPNVVSRLFWTSVIVIVTAFACLLSYSLYKRFDAMPTRITIENQFEPVNGLPYPAITICSPNQIAVSSMTHFNRTLVNGNRTFSVEYLVGQLIGFYDIVVLDPVALQELQMLLDLNRYTVQEVIALVPQSCERFLKLCFFHQKRYNNCKGLFKPILTLQGFCCIFNNMYSFKHFRRNEADPNFKYHEITDTGIAHGLTVITDYETEDALNETVALGGAARVILTPWYEFPYDDHTALVAPNREVFFTLSAIHTYCSESVAELPSHIRKCYYEHERYLPFFKQYHNSECDQLCFVLNAEKMCNCQFHHMPHVRISKTCNITALTCLSEVKRKMNRHNTRECDCPRDCDSLEYFMEMSVGNFDALPHLYTNIFKGIQFNKSTSIMHIFFPGPVYVKKKQETVMSLTTLASNLGGVFGLCLGCSVISAFEIFFYCYISIRNKIRKKTQKAPSNKENIITIPYIN